MKNSSRIILLGLLWMAATRPGLAGETSVKTPIEIFNATLTNITSLVQPADNAPSQTFSTRIKVVKADGLSKEFLGREVELAYQAPDRLRISATIDANTFQLGRNGQELWIHSPTKKFGLMGKPGVARFATTPDKPDTTQLGPFKLPMTQEQILALTALMRVEPQPSETIGQAACHVLLVSPLPQLVDTLKIPNGQLRLWIRTQDSFPAQIAYADGKGIDVQIQFQNIALGEPWPVDKWRLTAGPDDKVETVALSHLTRFLSATVSFLNQKIPKLGPATGERRVVATEGKGRLEIIDGTRVLFPKGTPEEMGRQHGALLKREIQNLVDRILYGVGIASSFEKGSWFIGEIESAQKRLLPFMDERYVREMDAMALAIGADKEEIRLANYFPELFHCSGFALFGEATVGGKMYHGRILDYLRGFGLEQNAVVTVIQPDKGNAWVNVGYAGFVGSVTAMNEKQVAMGEMGGRGEGQWDGKPMAQLLREVMEKANTLEEAVEIMRRGPRTCEYYYVISDAKTKRAVGIAATPTQFETIWPGQSHPRLPHGIKDTVLMSAGDRYEKLVERVRENFGKFDADKARDLMTRPVCMTSNIHSALFAPDTLDFWVANADSENVASHARFTHYNLGELLKPLPEKK